MRRIARGATLVAVVSAVAQEYVAARYYARTPGPSRFLEEDEQTAWTAPWHEMLAPAELGWFGASLLARADGLPRGTGQPVVLVPGFLLRGSYLQPLRAALARAGYRAEVAAIGRNADCIDVMTGRLRGVVAAAGAAGGSPVHLIGHSMGGLLARAAAVLDPERVASVTTLGAPYRGLRMHPALRATAMVVRALTHARRGPGVRPGCLTLACDCEAVRALAMPVSPAVPHLAIVTRHDGLSDWRYGTDPDEARVVEVTASHLGLVWNRTAFRAIAHHLAAARPAEGVAAEGQRSGR